MHTPRLILFEGIPGSGKTTAAARLQLHLQKEGFPSTFWQEGHFDHPADFEGIACLTAGDLQHFLNQQPALADVIQEYLSIRGEDHLLSYRKLQHQHPDLLPQSLLDAMPQKDVYDGLPMADYCRLALDRWQSFTQSAQESDAITLMECCFLQNPLTVMLARHNADPQFAREHILRLSRIIQPLNPLVIYLSPQNPRSALEHVRAERPHEWADFVTWYLTGQAYGQARLLSGFEGVIQFYTMRQQLELDLLPALPVSSLIVKQDGDAWNDRQQDINRFIAPYFLNGDLT
ncbi:MAG TPA: hypothetical protein PKW33_18165 [Anaerolineaceae bacterium]|nr:hypothetical protein [Anaerolineaceae bacterium]HPN53526.1 hypothetical protein [Anaerolineaceae bacterium]